MYGPFRIRKVVRGVGVAATGDEYLARLIKLIPSEVIAIYLTGIQLAKSWPGAWSFVCLILVIIARSFGTRDPGKKLQWIAVAVSSVSFIIWIYAIGGQFFGLILSPNTGIPSVAVLIWTFLVPFFYKGN